MLNEIYARHGCYFPEPGGEMERYFRQSWYRPRYANVDYLITETGIVISEKLLKKELLFS